MSIPSVQTIANGNAQGLVSQMITGGGLGDVFSQLVAALRAGLGGDANGVADTKLHSGSSAAGVSSLLAQFGGNGEEVIPVDEHEFIQHLLQTSPKDLAKEFQQLLQQLPAQQVQLGTAGDVQQLTAAYQNMGYSKQEALEKATRLVQMVAVMEKYQQNNGVLHADDLQELDTLSNNTDALQQEYRQVQLSISVYYQAFSAFSGQSQMSSGDVASRIWKGENSLLPPAETSATAQKQTAFHNTAEPGASEMSVLPMRDGAGGVNTVSPNTAPNTQNITQETMHTPATPVADGTGRQGPSDTNAQPATSSVTPSSYVSRTSVEASADFNNGDVSSHRATPAAHPTSVVAETNAAGSHNPAQVVATTASAAVMNGVVSPTQQENSAQRRPAQVAYVASGEVTAQPQVNKPVGRTVVTVKVGDDGSQTLIDAQGNQSGDMALEEVADQFFQKLVDRQQNDPRNQQLTQLARQANIGPQVSVAMRGVANDGGGQVRMLLNPPELGEIEIHLKVHDGKVTGHIAAQNIEVVEQMARELRSLQQGLQTSGFEMGKEGFQFLLKDQNPEGGQQGRGNEQQLAGGNGKQTEPQAAVQGHSGTGGGPWLQSNRLLDALV